MNKKTVQLFGLSIFRGAIRTSELTCACIALLKFQEKSEDVDSSPSAPAPAASSEPGAEKATGGEETAAVKPEAAEPSKMEAEGESPAPAATSGTTATSNVTPPASGDSDDEKYRRVYVGNLAWEVSWKDLKEHMKSTGLEVKLANVMTTPDGRSKGCGIVEFLTAADAQQAVLTLNDTELKGRQIFVREDREEQRGGGAGTHGAATGGAAGGGHHHHHSGGHYFSPGEQAKSRRVYVGNLSWDVAWQDLKDHMREAGEVVHAEIIREHNGRSKGCGIVEFASEEDAQNAINTLTDTELKGRMIFVREDRESSSQAGPGVAGGRGVNTSVYVWNLKPDVSWQDLKDHMRRAGNVDSATILTNPQGESVGCGVVVYQRPQEAARAIRELQNSELKGQPIYVREDRAQGGGRGGGGGGGGRGTPGRAGRGGRGGRGAARGGRGYRSTTEGAQVFVGNLSPDTTWKELKDHFRQCGEVIHAEVKTSYQGGSKGFGIVTFNTKEEAETAISRLDGSELQGSELEVRLDQKTH